MSFVLLGILNSQAAGVAQTFFLSTLSSNDFGQALGVVTSSSGNFYVAGREDTGTTKYSILAKYDSAGSLQWQRELQPASGQVRWDAVAVDSSENIYPYGLTDATGAGGNDAIIAKYDSSGNVVFQKTIGTSSVDQGKGIAIDSGNNLVLGGRHRFAATSDDLAILKMDSSGNAVWDKYLDPGNSNGDEAKAVAVDSGDNYILAGYSRSATGSVYNVPYLAKFDSSGNLVWQRALDAGSNTGEAWAVTVDSADNIYIAGEASASTSGLEDAFIAKYNSSGTLQWQKLLGGTSYEEFYGIDVDSADNIFVVGDSSDSGDDDFIVAKYDSSGNLQWQRSIGGTGATDRGTALAVDDFDNVIVVGDTFSTSSTSGDLFIAKIPNDGSLTGTYSIHGASIVYQASSLTATTPTYSSITPSFTNTTASFTISTSTITAATGDLTEYFVEIA